MLVYGDQREMADPAERLAGLERALVLLAEMPAGLQRHASLVNTLIEAGQLLQGVADAGVAAGALERLVYALAQSVLRSIDTGFADVGELPVFFPMGLPPQVELRVPEGYAFYALYPEAYATAARKLKLSAPPRVIGIRSIGTSLGAIVAAALDAPPPTTVRPFGDPFARQVELPSGQIEHGAHYVLVDEGPGLSGSSFGAVADALEGHGVLAERIAFVASHGGDLGPRASAAHRERWRKAQRVVAEFDSRFLSKVFGPLEPFSTGEPCERLKFLARAGDIAVLLKFAGLGQIGERKLEIARALHAAGLTPEPLGLVHGFLVERWRDDALRLVNEDKPVREIGHYVGTRARILPAPEASGAMIADLLEMCRRNLSLAFGQEAVREIERWNAVSLSMDIQRIRTDNKLDREEWLRLPNGQLLKTDALDHHCAHDLIGCQDMAWDLAGAIVEFALADDDVHALVAAAVEASGRSVSPVLLEFYRVAYCSFRLGQAKLSGELCREVAERERLHARAVRYETAVIRCLRES